MKIKNLEEHYKIVRNKIPEIIEKDGKTPVYKVLDDDKEYKRYLFEKLFEECSEARAATIDYTYEDNEEIKLVDKDKLIEELADVYEVLNTICNVYGIEPHEVRKKQLSKNIERGDFSHGIFLYGVIEHEL